MTKLKFALVVLVIGLIAGCASQPVENHRYFLPAANLTEQPKADDSARFLQIGEIQLADFLNDGGLVLQLDDITLNQAKNHEWAEDLRQQINRGLRDRLNQRQQPFVIVGPQTTAELRLSLTIDAFHGRHDGLALTSGQWQLINAQGDMIDLQNFELQTELSRSGYPALVRALGKNLDDLASLLARELDQQ